MTITTDTREPATARPVDQPRTVPAARARDVRWELAAALRHFGRLGYEFGANGHVSARAPEAPGHYWVNPFGVSISAVTPSDLVLADDRGQVVESRGSYSISGFAGNLALHQAVPEAAAAVHLHTPRGFIWSALGRPLEAVNTDSALVVGLQGLSAQLLGDATTPSALELARQGARVLVRRNHGFWTWGETVGEAAFYLEAAERAADANLVLASIGGVQLVPDDLAARFTLTPERARINFEPTYTRYEAEGLR